MRWHIPFLLTLLVTSLAFAGCTTAPEVETEEDTTPDPGHAYVRIHVKRPLDAEKHPIWTLQAVPRLVAFLAGDNETAASIGNDEGYVSVARGWAGNAEQYGEDEYPQAAVRDWLQPNQLWFEGQVPAGNYSTVRIELMEVRGTHTDGTDLNIRLVGDRLSVGPSSGKFFEIEEGREMTFVFDAFMQQESKYTYTIK